MTPTEPGPNRHKAPTYRVSADVKFEECGNLTSIRAVTLDPTFSKASVKTCAISLLTMANENPKSGRREFDRALSDAANKLDFSTTTTVREAIKELVSKGYMVPTGDKAYAGGPWVYYTAQPLGRTKANVKPGSIEAGLREVADLAEWLDADRSRRARVTKIAKGIPAQAKSGVFDMTPGMYEEDRIYPDHATVAQKATAITADYVRLGLAEWRAGPERFASWLTVESEG